MIDFSSVTPKQVVDAVYVIVSSVTALSAWRAAKLWRDASMIKMPAFDPPVASMDDNPALHILSTSVQLNDAQNAFERSSEINARAANWAAVAAMLTGFAMLVSIVQSHV